MAFFSECCDVRCCSSKMVTVHKAKNHREIIYIMESEVDWELL